MGKDVLVLQHVPNEGAGTMLDFLKVKKIPVRFVALYKGDALPGDFDNFHSVLIMGGPMNVYEEEKYPFLKEEPIFIKQLIDREIPTLGICLGAQLIAKALGAPVYKAARPEIGWFDVDLSSAAANDPIFSLISSPQFRVLQWHEDTFDLPLGAIHLASSSAAPNQAYRIGKNIYGLQFHIEANEWMMENWFNYSHIKESILSEYRLYRGALENIANRIYEKFFEMSSQ